MNPEHAAMRSSPPTSPPPTSQSNQTKGPSGSFFVSGRQSMIAASTTTTSAATGKGKSKSVSLSPVGRGLGNARTSGDHEAGETVPEKAKTSQSGSTEAALIVLGRDASGKAHASWFGPADAPLAAKAADMMGMAALEAATDELRALAGKLPQGRVFASGRAFVPFVRASLFADLLKHAPEAGVMPSPTSAAASGEEGELGATSAAETGAGSIGDKASPPSDWPQIGVGHMVLASDDIDDGWWEAVVLKRSTEDLLTLKWQAWPELGQFVRRVEHVALLHPTFDARKPRS